jgi:hypothetical protein
MSLSRLSAQYQTARVTHRSIDHATITIRRVKPTIGQRGFSGRVLVDRHILGYLVADEPRSFEVEPCEHTITVLFGRRPVILCRPGSARCTVSVSLSAGERVDFACGIRSDISRLWVQARRAREIRLTALIAAFYCALGLNWLCGPYLREAVALVVWYLSDHGLLIPLSYRMAGPIICGLGLAMLNGWMLRRWPQTRDTSDAVLLYRIGCPYYLERLTAVGIDGK